jgi:hypothetical protein
LDVVPYIRARSYKLAELSVLSDWRFNGQHRRRGRSPPARPEGAQSKALLYVSIGGFSAALVHVLIQIAERPAGTFKVATLVGYFVLSIAGSVGMLLARKAAFGWLCRVWPLRHGTPRPS